MKPLPQPDITTVSEPYWQALEDGYLTYQECRCGHRWLPPRHECPACLGNDWNWRRASGRGRIVSWVIYHVAYHEAFADRIPYNVTLVEIDEGPRVITNIIDCPDGRGLHAGGVVELSIEIEQGIPLARFTVSGNDQRKDE